MNTGESMLVIIPTYNEIESIEKIIESIFEHSIQNTSILVVDDNSPDGTGNLAEKLSKKNSRIKLIRRPKKLGLGTAYVKGFKYALENNFDYIFEIDADFSHNPAEIPNFLEKIKDADMVIGSRYIEGVNVVHWPLRRLILSYSANVYTRIITGIPVKDGTAGYVCYKRKVLESLNLDNIHSGGYAFQIEMKFKAWKKGFRLIEIPIIFVDRTIGTSKMSKQIVIEAIWMVWRLKFSALLNRL